MLRTCIAGLLWWMASCWPATASATDACPGLPADSGLQWEQRDVPGMLFCKAIGDDGIDVLSVMLSGSSPFRPQNALIEGSGNIAGRKVRWFRGEDGFNTGPLLRETVVRLGRGRVAHVVVRASSEDRLASALVLAESLAFAEP